MGGGGLGGGVGGGLGGGGEGGGLGGGGEGGGDGGGRGGAGGGAGVKDGSPKTPISSRFDACRSVDQLVDDGEVVARERMHKGSGAVVARHDRHAANRARVVAARDEARLTVVREHPAAPVRGARLVRGERDAPLVHAS